MKIKLSLLANLVLTAVVCAGNLGLVQMESGDKIEITRHSTGCFHDSTSYYEVQKLDGLYRFREYSITWTKSIPREIAEKKTEGEKILTASEVLGLDNLLDFYRGKKDAFSTTQVSLLVEYFESDRRIKTENLEDGSGGHGLEKRKDVVTLYILANRMKEQIFEAEPVRESSQNSSTTE